MSKEKNEKLTYNLYATRTTEAVIEAVSAMRFARITAGYTLVYCEDENTMRKTFPFIEYTIIKDEETNRLSSADKEWLMNCNFTIITEEALKNKEIVLQNMTDALDALEAELEKRRIADNSSAEAEEN